MASHGKPVRTLEDGARLYGVGRILPDVSDAPAACSCRRSLGAGWARTIACPRGSTLLPIRAPAEATELMVRLLRERAAFEANLFDENNAFLVAASAFPYFYALVGERNPQQAPKAGSALQYSQLACDAFEVDSPRRAHFEAEVG